jgi:hypothetical protein
MYVKLYIEALIFAPRFRSILSHAQSENPARVVVHYEAGSEKLVGCLVRYSLFSASAFFWGGRVLTLAL